MKIFSRAAALTAGVAALALAMTGCSGAETGGTSSDKVELSMLVNITPNLTQTWWESLVKPFEDANPNIDVKIQAPVAKGVQPSLVQLLASGDVPDIVQSLPPTAELAPELLDLSSYDFAKNAPLADNYKLDGKNYIAGVGQQLQGTIFYNKAAFKEAGITETPKTFEEFEAGMGKLKDAGWDPIQTGGEWITQLTVQYMGIPTVYSEYPDWYAGMNSGDLTWGQTYGSIADAYAGWVKKGYIPKDAAGIKYADAEQRFLDGKAAMYPMGSWFAAAAASADKADEFGVFAAPAVAGTSNPKVISNVASPYAIMKATKNQDAAVKLVEYLTTDKDAVVTQLKVDTNFRDGFEYETDALGAEMQAILDATPQENFTPSGDGYGDLTSPKGYQLELNTQAQAVLIGGSADAFKKAMDDWWAANR